MTERCMWCRRGDATQTLSFGWHDLALKLCSMCARLLAPSAFESDLHDELDVRYLAQQALDDRLAEVYASGTDSPDRCWWCARPAAAIDCVVHVGDQLLFEGPVLCNVCVGLSGQVGGGFAHADDEWSRAADNALEVLERELTPPTRTLRERDVDLVIVKLALLEVEANRFALVYPCDGFSELASSLGLAEDETRAQILSLWSDKDSLVTFKRFDDGIVPVLSQTGRSAFVEIEQAYRLGPPYAHPALSNRSVRRTLDIIDATTAAPA